MTRLPHRIMNPVLPVSRWSMTALRAAGHEPHATGPDGPGGDHPDAGRGFLAPPKSGRMDRRVGARKGSMSYPRATMIGMRPSLACAGLLFGVLAWTQAAAAADARAGAPDPWSNPIAADRPGAANPTSVVGAGVVQLETALESIRQGALGEPRDGLLDFPTTLRVGGSGALEARLESPPLSRLSPGGGGASVSGFSDVSLEVKWRVRGAGRGAAPALALLPTLVIPMGSDAFSAHDYQLGVTGLGDWTLGESGSLGLNLVVA